MLLSHKLPDFSGTQELDQALALDRDQALDQAQVLEMEIMEIMEMVETEEMEETEATMETETTEMALETMPTTMFQLPHQLPLLLPHPHQNNPIHSTALPHRQCDRDDREEGKAVEVRGPDGDNNNNNNKLKITNDKISSHLFITIVTD